jgi:hypothetical protein
LLIERRAAHEIGLRTLHHAQYSARR